MTARFGVTGVLSAVLLGALVQSAAALEISQHSKDSPEVNAILLKGRVEDGDTYELKTYLAKLPKKARTVVYLESPGGDLREGMRLGKLFYVNKIETVVESKTRCTSSCALAFLGGRNATSDTPARIKHAGAGLGFHSFTRDFENDKRYSADDMKFAIQRTQTEVAGVAEYLRAIDTDLDVLRIMFGATAKQMAYVTNDEAIGLGVQVWDEKRSAFLDPAPVLERLARARAEEKLAAAMPVKPASTTAPVSSTGGGAAGTAAAAPTATVVPVAAPKPAVLPNASKPDGGRSS
jgi:hypothetical protein